MDAERDRAKVEEGEEERRRRRRKRRRKLARCQSVWGSS
jgi:hypothetical protein